MVRSALRAGLAGVPRRGAAPRASGQWGPARQHPRECASAPRRAHWHAQAGGRGKGKTSVWYAHLVEFGTRA